MIESPICIVSTLLAYVGPGAGLSAIGAFLALVAGIAIAVFGFVWYPIKRLLRKRSKRTSSDATEANE